MTKIISLTSFQIQIIIFSKMKYQVILLAILCHLSLILQMDDEDPTSVNYQYNFNMIFMSQFYPFNYNNFCIKKCKFNDGRIQK
jgi:hypothetical protein